MKRTARILTLLLLLLSAGTTALLAQSPAKYGSQKSLMGIEVHFRWDDSRLDLTYMGNAGSLDRLQDVINLIGTHRIDSLIIVSQSSPEGKYAHNIRLSQRRAATMHSVISQRHPELTDRLHVNPEVRYWFGADSSWRDHYVGLFVGAGYYDLENGARGYKGEHVLWGLSYGYMFSIGKRLSLDAGIGVGAMVTEYEEYLPIDACYVYQQTSRTRYFGPLKLRLALTWRVDRWKLNKLGQWLKGGRP